MIRKLGMDDMEELLRLEGLCFEQPWEPGMFRAGLSGHAQEEFHGWGSPGNLEAYVGLSWPPGELHVVNLACAPPCRGRGLARGLMRHSLGLARQRKAHRALLEVRPSNEAAWGLYKSLGFSKVGVRRGYYQQDGEDAWVLEKGLGLTAQKV